MSLKVLPKLDKFYLLFIVVMILTAGYIIFAFKTIFDAVSTSSDIGAQFTEVELKIDKDKLDKALKIAEDKKIIELEVR